MAKTISFTPPNVKLILEGHKTQTRRIAKAAIDDDGEEYRDADGWPLRYVDGAGDLRVAPPYKVGDVAHVREGWRVGACWDRTKPRDLSMCVPVRYEATAWQAREVDGWGKYRPAMFMPLWASRLKLEILDVRLERLNDCSEEDARAEGAEIASPAGGLMGASYALGYRAIWEDINGPGSWDANPWVWAYTFRRV